MFKQLLVCAALGTILMVNPVNAQQSPPTSEKAKQQHVGRESAAHPALS
jgi:hypothetical protein